MVQKTFSKSGTKMTEVQRGCAQPETARQTATFPPLLAQRSPVVIGDGNILTGAASMQQRPARAPKPRLNWLYGRLTSKTPHKPYGTVWLD